MTPIAVTIAASDSSGGAGIAADLKTFSALGVYGASIITALTAQNTNGVTGIHAVPAEFVTAQIDAVFADLDVGAVKIGMVAQALSERARSTMTPVSPCLSRSCTRVAPPRTTSLASSPSSRPPALSGSTKA